MAIDLDVSDLPGLDTPPFELVERKGIGHPDTLCDAIAERFSIALSRFYVERFGAVLHHNVDKVLLWGGAAEPRFGGGSVKEPIEIFLAGRATTRFKGVDVPVESLAIEAGRAYLRETFHTLDPERHVKFHCLVRPGSEDLVELFQRRQRAGVWLANDSSLGVGFAPLSALEESVLAIDRALRDPAVKRAQPAFGEDTKLLALRRGAETAYTVACAFCDRSVADLAGYLEGKAALGALVRHAAGAAAEVTVNAADEPEAGSIYLTVTGTSAEAGDDGQAGRGNRANGLITPLRPMTMESVAGKNPVSHVGKLYNLAARAIAESVVRDVPEVVAAECYLASRIGRPVKEPQLAHLRLRTRDGKPAAELAWEVEPILHAHLAELDTLWRTLLTSAVPLF
ncbi:MAG TPA: methionine adenosyltransferase [Stellaceae bacterium]|nr:methionine adenosyltransferase [Stellaceae bacterium]